MKTEKLLATMLIAGITTCSVLAIDIGVIKTKEIILPDSKITNYNRHLIASADYNTSGQPETPIENGVQLITPDDGNTESLLTEKRWLKSSETNMTVISLWSADIIGDFAWTVADHYMLISITSTNFNAPTIITEKFNIAVPTNGWMEIPVEYTMAPTNSAGNIIKNTFIIEIGE
jgi:hypothetical protein